MHYMDCAGSLDGINKELGGVFFRRSTTDGIDQCMSKDDNRNVSVGERFDLEQWSTIHSGVYEVRTNYSVKPFCNRKA